MVRNSRNLELNVYPRLHDLAVGREDEDEAVEGLEEVRAELLEDLGAPRQRRLHPPPIAQTWKKEHDR